MHVRFLKQHCPDQNIPCKQPRWEISYFCFSFLFFSLSPFWVQRNCQCQQLVEVEEVRQSRFNWWWRIFVSKVQIIINITFCCLCGVWSINSGKWRTLYYIGTFVIQQLVAMETLLCHDPLVGGSEARVLGLLSTVVLRGHLTWMLRRE